MVAYQPSTCWRRAEGCGFEPRVDLIFLLSVQVDHLGTHVDDIILPARFAL